MSKETGGPAFPNAVKVTDEDYADLRGMSLRDWFAGKELAKKDSTCVCDIPESYARLADHCYQMADAMLAERNK